jgi:DNA polymerase
LKLPVQQGLFDPAPSYEAARELVASSEKFAGAMRRLGVVVPTKPGAGGAIPAVAKTDAFMARSLVSTDPRVKLMAKARQAITSNLGETRAATLVDMALRGPMPIYINYSAAHTHRFSGGDGNNIQNFTRGSLLRDSVCAPPGHVCVVADLSQIEARGVAWLAGQLDLLEVFREADRTRGDFYSMFGSQVFQRKITKADPERQISKALALGMSYGMGTETFSINLINSKTQFCGSDATKFNVDVPRYVSRLKKDKEGRTAVDRVVEAMGRPREAMEAHLAVTEYFVQLYRTTYSKIAALWKECDDVIKWMAETDRPIKWRGGLVVGRGTITKPGGLVLRYPGIRKGDRGWEYSEGKLYGGLLTENLVQSISRDVLCDMVLRVQARGYRSRMTVHDELVVVVPEAEGAKVLEEVISIMRCAPKWCETWPMNADGGYHLRWGRAKK